MIALIEFIVAQGPLTVRLGEDGRAGEGRDPVTMIITAAPAAYFDQKRKTTSDLEMYDKCTKGRKRRHEIRTEGCGMMVPNMKLISSRSHPQDTQKDDV